MRHNNCPYCGASWVGDPIPEESQESYGATHFKREIGLYDMELDITIAFKCPDCEGEVWRNGELRKGPIYNLSKKDSIKP